MGHRNESFNLLNATSVKVVHPFNDTDLAILYTVGLEPDTPNIITQT